MVAQNTAPTRKSRAAEQPDGEPSLAIHRISCGRASSKPEVFKALTGWLDGSIVAPHCTIAGLPRALHFSLHFGMPEGSAARRAEQSFYNLKDCGGE